MVITCQRETRGNRNAFKTWAADQKGEGRAAADERACEAVQGNGEIKKAESENPALVELI